MSIQRLNPYLILDGNAAQAIAHYQEALGAKAEVLQRYGDMPGNKQPAELKDRVMHALLRIGDGVVMVSDAPPGKAPKGDGNVEVCLDCNDAEDMALKFERLAVGGTVTQPLQDMFWGAKFGTLTDAYGVRWMFNCMR